MRIFCEPFLSFLKPREKNFIILKTGKHEFKNSLSHSHWTFWPLVNNYTDKQQKCKEKSEFEKMMKTPNVLPTLVLAPCMQSFPTKYLLHLHLHLQ